MDNELIGGAEWERGQTTGKREDPATRVVKAGDDRPDVTGPPGKKAGGLSPDEGIQLED